MPLTYDTKHAGQLVMVHDPATGIHELAILFGTVIFPQDYVTPPNGSRDDTAVVLLSGRTADLYRLPARYVSREAICSPDPLAQQLDFAYAIAEAPRYGFGDRDLDLAAQAVALMLAAYPDLAPAALAAVAPGGVPADPTDDDLTAMIHHAYSAPDPLPRPPYYG